MSVGIIGTGAYVPRLRLQRAEIARATMWFNQALKSLGRGERSMANWDEDAITMAVEAARDCLLGRDRESVARIVLASTSLPFADRQNAGLLKEALALPDNIGALDATGSQRAGTSALISSLEASERAGLVLCVASERRLARAASPAEFTNGDAAAALLVGPGKGIADLLCTHSTTVDFVDHFRASDREHDYEWESRWIRDEGYARLLPHAIATALAKAGVEAAAVDHFALALPLAGAERSIAKTARIRPEALVEPFDDTLGYAGTAQPLLMLDRALRRASAGQIVVVASFGQGVDVLVFRATDEIQTTSAALGVDGWLERRTPEHNYIKHLYFTRQLQLEEGMRAELDLKTPPTMLYRDRRTILALMGGRCRVTGAVQYPKSAITAAPDSRLVDTQDDYPLADRAARLVTVTSDRLAYSPDPPSHYGMIDFEGGGRMLADITDVEGDDLAVGTPLRMMFRLKRHDARGFRHYFWKAVPDYRSPGIEAVDNG